MKLLLALTLLSTLTLAAAQSQIQTDYLQQAGSVPSAQQLITSKGYPFASYYVKTADNYVLNVFRIPRNNAPVVFLQHGVLDSADTWLVNDASRSLAYILYDQGFDVWLGNSRGNKYSRNNTQLSPNWPFDADFWDFSFDDMARYDLPAQLNYALQSAQRSKLVLVGHSQGCTQSLANLVTSDWSLSDRISLFIALAPVSYLSHTTSTLVRALATVHVDQIVAILGVHEFLPSNTLIKWLLPNLCSATPALCDSFINLFAGFDQNDLDQALLPTYVAHFPSGTSVFNMQHWAQLTRSGRFERYDYGLVENLIKYRASSPPAYQLSKMSTNVAIFYGKADALANPTDVQKLINELPKDKLVLVDMNEEYAHLDFVWGYHAASTIYPKVVSLARQYS